jgi:hypothetical protein
MTILEQIIKRAYYLKKQEPVVKKNYHEFLDIADIDLICSISIKQIMDNMEVQLKAEK